MTITAEQVIALSPHEWELFPVKKKCKFSHYRKYDISKIQNLDAATTFEAKISQELIFNPVNDQSADKEWKTIRDIVTETIDTVISVLTPMLFTLYLAVMFPKLPSGNPGFDMRYRYVGGLSTLVDFDLNI